MLRERKKGIKNVETNETRTLTQEEDRERKTRNYFEGVEQPKCDLSHLIREKLLPK